MENTKRQEILTHCRYLLESYDKEAMQQAYSALLKIKLDAVVSTAKTESKNDTKQETKSIIVEHCDNVNDDCALPPILSFDCSRGRDIAENRSIAQESTTQGKTKRGRKRHKDALQNNKAGNA